MKKNIFSILCCIALTAVVVGCSPEENIVTPTGLDRTTINFEATGGSASFAITTPSAWTISAAGVEWLTIDPMSGVGNTTVNVTAANLAITQSRSVTLTISAENAPAETILVFQTGTSVPVDAGTIQGVDINSCPVETVELTIAIDGATSYQWFMNGNAISGATTNTYIVTQSGIYNVAGVNATGMGAQSPNKIVTITECILPDDAGTIQGFDENTCPARTVTLTIAEIGLAETYNWYRNGTLISGATTATYTVTQSGTYTVAGLNPTGEGALSPEKVVTINDCGDYRLTDALVGTWSVTGTILAGNPASLYDAARTIYISKIDDATLLVKEIGGINALTGENLPDNAEVTVDEAAMTLTMQATNLNCVFFTDTDGLWIAPLTADQFCDNMSLSLTIPVAQIGGGLYEAIPDAGSTIDLPSGTVPTSTVYLATVAGACAGGGLYAAGIVWTQLDNVAPSPVPESIKRPAKPARKFAESVSFSINY